MSFISVTTKIMIPVTQYQNAVRPFIKNAIKKTAATPLKATCTDKNTPRTSRCSRRTHTLTIRCHHVALIAHSQKTTQVI